VPLSQFPARATAYTRALRDVKIQEAIYEFVTQQFEQYRILELRDTPVLQVLDPGAPAEKRYKPIRWLICSVATLLAFAFSCLLAFILDSAAALRRDEPSRWPCSGRRRRACARGAGSPTGTIRRPPEAAGRQAVFLRRLAPALDAPPRAILASGIALLAALDALILATLPRAGALLGAVLGAAG